MEEIFIAIMERIAEKYLNCHTLTRTTDSLKPGRRRTTTR